MKLKIVTNVGIVEMCSEFTSAPVKSFHAMLSGAVPHFLVSECFLWEISSRVLWGHSTSRTSPCWSGNILYQYFLHVQCKLHMFKILHKHWSWIPRCWSKVSYVSLLRYVAGNSAPTPQQCTNSETSTGRRPTSNLGTSLQGRDWKKARMSLRMTHKTTSAPFCHCHAGAQ